MRFLFISFFLIYLLGNSYAQWNRINSLPIKAYTAIKSHGDTIIACSEDGIIYKSIDEGDSWLSYQIATFPIYINTFSIIHNDYFIGTLGEGIFVSQNGGLNWNNQATFLPAISGFAEFNDTIYAATLGYGVYRLNSQDNSWYPFNIQLPSNLAYNVEAIIATPQQLLISAGANGYYFIYNFPANQWDLNYFYGNLSPGMQITRLSRKSDTLFATSANRILQSTDGGQTWQNDKVGSHNGADRAFHMGREINYSATNISGGGSWFQKRAQHLTAGSDWSFDEEYFPDGHIYEILEFNEKIFLAKDNGIFVNDLPTTLEEEYSVTITVNVFPNPTKTGLIQIECQKVIANITILDFKGQIIKSANPNCTNYTFPTEDMIPGNYFIWLEIDGKSYTKQIILQ